MRHNPKVCMQVDEIGSRSNWTSVVVDGTYLELREPQHAAEKERAREQLRQSAELVGGANGTAQGNGRTIYQSNSCFSALPFKP
jgi:nitroimidazol reductase NimA-like FMN-containing flavoprotein (pyridoxamine 5'-phosphate oxidase superfamily)